MNLEYADETHTYRIDGAVAPSVTQLLADEGFYWNPFAEDSHLNLGSKVHELCYLVDGQPWTASSPEQLVARSRWDPATTGSILVPYGWAWARFCVEHQFHAVYCEHVVGSAIYQIAGRLDRWGMCGMTKTNDLIDIKSGQPSPQGRVHGRMQTALYALLLGETYGVRTDHRKVVWLMTDGTFRVEHGQPRDLQVALAIVTVWKERKQHNLFS